MSQLRMIVAMVAAASLAASAAQALSPSRSAEIKTLKLAKKRLDRAAQVDKPAHAIQMQRQSRTLESLIQDLQAGKHVDPAEIERVLKDVRQ